MRTISKIAKNELRYLFYSPIAWFLAIVMLVVSSFYYTTVMYYMSLAQEMVKKLEPGHMHTQIDSFTEMIFSYTGAFFPNMAGQLFLFVPLLTMGVINREFNNGTIQLLYSSPVKLRQIVLGKYLAIVLYSLMLISISGIFILLGFADIKSLDWAPLLSASFGMLLYLGALTAIGFFMSSLTSYQIVSAIASFTVLFVLSRIGGLWQQYDFVRDITWFLSMEGRTERMLRGLISSKDVLYYFVIIFIFVSFTYLKMKDGLEKKSWYVRTMRYSAVVIFSITVGYLGSRPVATIYWDTTQRQMRTVHPKTQEILRQFNDGPLEVTLYTNLFHKGVSIGLPRERNKYLSHFWEPYQRFKPDIHYKYEYYYAAPTDPVAIRANKKLFPGKSLQQVAGLTAKNMQVDSTLFKPLSEMADSALLTAEDHRLLMKLTYKGRTAILRTFLEEGIRWTPEPVVNATLNQLLGEPAYKVFFITGQLERSIYKKGEREYHTFVANKYKNLSLINNGYEVDTLNLNLHNIPTAASLLVLADPKMELTDTVLNKLRTYIQSGGNMLIMGEPGKQYVTNPLLSELGVQLNEGQLVEPSVKASPDEVVHYVTKEGLDMADEKHFLLVKHLWSNGMYRDSSLLRLGGVTSISVTDGSMFTMKPLLMTRPGSSWLKAGKLIKDSTAPVFSPAEGDTREVSSIAGIQLTRRIQGKEQRVVVTGDADFYNNSRGNWDFVMGLYSWFTNNQFPVYTNYPYAKDNELTLSAKRASIQRIVFTWVLPVIVLLTGAILLIRRKRK